LKQKGTTAGDTASKNYNEYIRYATMRAGMIDLLKKVNHHYHFKDAIITHFYLQRDNILQQCQTWIDECVDNEIRNNMIQALDEIKMCFSSLVLPN
jgi:hypothetical protein